MTAYIQRVADYQTLRHRVDWNWETTYGWYGSVREQPVDTNNRRSGSFQGKSGSYLYASSRAKLKKYRFYEDKQPVGMPRNPVSFIGTHGDRGHFVANVHYPSGQRQQAAIARAESLAYDRFYRGRRGLLAGSSSLGVTLASWKQSRDMIVKRSNDARNIVAKLAYAIERDPRRKAWIRRQHSLDPSTPASVLLETKFGWGPLFEDLESAVRNVVAFGADEEVWFYHTGRGKVREKLPDTRHTFGFPSQWAEISNWETTLSSTYSASVRVENRNLYMLNRLGLINPATVAWDLVPWSFVVNMFGNFNSLISSVTDEVGLEVRNEAITNTVKSRRTETQRCWGRSYITLEYEAFSKHRRLNAKPVLRFEARVPELNWDLAVTASALAMQRIKFFTNFLRIF